MQDIDEVYHKKLEASKEEIYEACQGFITTHHVYMLQIIRQEMDNMQPTIESLDQRIKEVLSPYENALELLKKVPGISFKSAEDLVAEIVLDMNVFPTEKHLAFWAGMLPNNNESASKKKRTHNSWEQTSKKYTCHDSMGSHKNKKHILSYKVPQNGSTPGQERGPDSRRTFDPEVSLSNLEEKLGLQRAGGRIFNYQNRSQT